MVISEPQAPSPALRVWWCAGRGYAWFSVALAAALSIAASSSMMLPLPTIGVSLVSAQHVVPGLAGMGLGISPQTVVFMTAMMMGAGVDYAVLLVSGYHENLRRGSDSDAAVAPAPTSIGKVIAASTATVAVTFLAMSFIRLQVFSPAGAALAFSISIALLAAVTFLPARLVIAGRCGWAAPKRDQTNRLWRRSGIHIVRRPRAHLLVSVVILAALATAGGMIAPAGLIFAASMFGMLFGSISTIVQAGSWFVP